ncbi:MAG: PAQR family membrane homeostasis protein TrhA [Thermoplasmatota archaeon]
MGDLPPSERFNLASHGLGALLAMGGTAFLVARAQTTVEAIILAFYGLTLVFMFAASTLHHAVPREDPKSRLDPFRRLDHIAIYALIMGTYAPPCLLDLPPLWGLPLFAIVFGLGTAGIVLKIVRPLTDARVTAGLYVALGWSGILASSQIIAIVPPEGLFLLAGGGVIYTIGALVYARKKPDLFPRYLGFHGLWHIFVLVGAALQFLFIAGYAPAA